MSDHDTLLPCPMCERCPSCRGTHEVPCRFCNRVHMVDCSTCDTCSLCEGTHLVAEAIRERWLSDNVN